MTLWLLAMLSARGVTWTPSDIQSEPLMMVLYNDGKTTVDTTKLRHELLLNGKPMRGEWVDAFFGSAPSIKPRLRPGEHVQFGVRLGQLITKPGFYRISWRGTGFASNEARFLVKEKF